MTVIRAIRRGDVWGVVSGVLSVVTLAFGEFFAVELGRISLASSLVGILLFVYALVWFAVHLYSSQRLHPNLVFNLREAVDEDAALLRIVNDWRYDIILREIHLLYVRGGNEIELPPNTTVLNEYDVRQHGFHDGPPVEFELGGQSLELGRGLQPDDEIRCLKFAWKATISPSASSNIKVDMDPRDSGNVLIPLLWIRVFPDLPVSELVPIFGPAVIDRLFDPIPLAMVEEAFNPGLTPRVFGTEYIRLDQSEIDVDWPPDPEC